MEENVNKEALESNQELEERRAKKKEKKRLKKEFEKWLASKNKEATLEGDRPLFSSEEEPKKALATFFRNQNKSILTSMVMADRKAMIMIRINSLIVSIAMIFFRFINEEIPYGWLIAIVLIIGTGGALIFSILAARPNNRYIRKIGYEEIFPKYPELEYRNFWIPDEVSLEEYEESMDKVVNSQELQIGNQVRFTYLMEKNLIKKYFLLDVAYNLFLGSMVLSAIIFLLCRIFVV